MKIRYLDCDGKAKLFSFHEQDYKTETIDGNRYMIDGGCELSELYCRTSLCGIIKVDTVENLIEDIRQQFTWTSQLDHEGKRLTKSITRRLKDITTPPYRKI